MTHLIVSAHPSEKSFTHILARALQQWGNQNGWNVVHRNLYALGFNPVLSSQDLAAFQDGETSDEIAKEQQHVADAQLITIIYPLWWAGFPAILKGYFDRVLSYGFAYGIENGIPVPLLQGKKVMVFTTMGNKISDYEAKNLITAFQTIHRDEIFGFCGMKVIDHQFFGRVTTLSGEEMQLKTTEVLEQYSRLFLTEEVENQI